MQFYRQKWIERVDLTNNPNAVFLFGDNTKRLGLGGQAKSMRGEPNAIGIATKWEPSNAPEAFFSDDDFILCSRVISGDFRKAFAARDHGKTIIIPADGLGTGLSRLPELAPKVNAHLEWMLELLTTNRMPAWKQLLNDDG